ncbi:hypothetical protein ACFQ2B_11645 [Streptomyces stramineus]
MVLAGGIGVGAWALFQDDEGDGGRSGGGQAGPGVSAWPTPGPTDDAGIGGYTGGSTSTPTYPPTYAPSPAPSTFAGTGAPNGYVTTPDPAGFTLAVPRGGCAARRAPPSSIRSRSARA